MTTRYVKRIVLALALAAIIAGTVGITTTSKAEADGWCWCTDYVANYYNLNRNYPNADQWTSWLTNGQAGHVFSPNSSPANGNIIVIQPYVKLALQTGGNWTAGSVGHVAIVAHESYYGHSRWLIDLKGANQGWGSQYDASGCTDVSDFNVWVTVGGSLYGYYHW